MPNLYNPDYLQQLCQKYGLSPSKKYGQNYLIDSAVIEKIVEAAEISNNDIIVEVGPGFGALTLALAEAAERVIAFEIEKKLMSYWGELQKKNKNIEIVWGNVLKEVESQKSIKSIRYKVVANLPYQITSPVTRLFLESEQKPELLVLMVQKEVAERICAKPGDMSLLAISVQYYADPEYVLTVPRSSFWPSPNVDSAVIRLKVKPEMRSDLSLTLPLKREGTATPPFKEWSASRPGEVTWEQFFFRVVKAGFANRRKLLIKNLQPIVGGERREELKNIFIDLGFSPNTRAQELSVEQWEKLVYKVGLINP